MDTPPRLHLLPSDEDGPTATRGDARRILVVDDDRNHRRDVRDVLEDEGYEVVEAENGQEALNYLIGRRSFSPALVLLDLSMPAMTGWELLAIMRSYLRLSAIPVVLLSGLDPQLDPVKHGAIAAFLKKPYDVAQLLEVVGKHSQPSGSAGG
jgi:CheY-like chemotaxis protein